MFFFWLFYLKKNGSKCLIIAITTGHDKCLYFGVCNCVHLELTRTHVYKHSFWKGFLLQSSSNLFPLGNPTFAILVVPTILIRNISKDICSIYLFNIFLNSYFFQLLISHTKISKISIKNILQIVHVLCSNLFPC